MILHAWKERAVQFVGITEIVSETGRALAGRRTIGNGKGDKPPLKRWKFVGAVEACKNDRFCYPFMGRNRVGKEKLNSTVPKPKGGLSLGET